MCMCATLISSFSHGRNQESYLLNFRNDMRFLMKYTATLWSICCDKFRIGDKPQSLNHGVVCYTRSSITNVQWINDHCKTRGKLFSIIAFHAEGTAGEGKEKRGKKPVQNSRGAVMKISFASQMSWASARVPPPTVVAFRAAFSIRFQECILSIQDNRPGMRGPSASSVPDRREHEEVGPWVCGISLSLSLSRLRRQWVIHGTNTYI